MTTTTEDRNFSGLRGFPARSALLRTQFPRVFESIQVNKSATTFVLLQRSVAIKWLTGQVRLSCI